MATQLQPGKIEMFIGLNYGSTFEVPELRGQPMPVHKAEEVVQFVMGLVGLLAYTMETVTGFWEGSEEKSLKVYMYGPSDAQQQLFVKAAKTLKASLGQDAVLVAYTANVDVILV